jgi:hypothetical protein
MVVSRPSGLPALGLPARAWHVLWLLVVFAIMGLPAEVAAQGLKSGVGHIDTKGFVAPVAVFGKDDRRRLPKRLSALQDGIGVLFSVRDKSLCSAFCVGDDMIATAAHCFYRTAQEPLPDIRHFVFGRIREEIRTHTRIAGFQSGSSPQNVLSGSMRLRIRPPIEATRDWALARLAKPLCRGQSRLHNFGR